ncbi:MAG: M28 family peptidase [Acidobacteriota bacterium]|nr:M28 family peptidase [Acidobacteriota bacterium]
MKKFSPALIALLFALLPFSAAPQLARQTPATATATTLSASTVDAAKQITAARLSEHLHVVASDAMGGRDTPSQGLDATAKYIADDLKKIGVKPAGDDGTYFQRITLKRDKVDPAHTTFTLGDTAYNYGDDFLTAGTSGSAEGPLVFVSHGYVIKSKGIDAYKGVDVKDKIMVVAGTGLPAGVTRADVRGKAGVDYDDAISYGQRNGARGIIYAPRPRGGDIARWWGFIRGAATRGNYRVERFGPAGSPNLPSVYASQKLIEAIFAGEPVAGADVWKQAQGGEGAPAPAAFALSPQKRAKFNISSTSDTATTQNVVGILEGRDPQLKSEYVALGAHYDHIGTAGQGSGQCQELDGDKICNGADDDGSGTVSILTIAEAFAKGPRPRRSILFVWHCGEEKGLWGSQYFTNFPTVPLDRVVTQLNIDMIGRSKKEGDTTPADRDLSGPNEIYVIGSKMMSTDLGNLSERVNSEYMNVSFNYKYDDPRDPNRFFFRSDHFNYAQKGVPIIFYFDGVHEDYHRPGDEPDKIDYQKMEKVARTVFATATELANQTARPKVDKQLPSELTER